MSLNVSNWLCSSNCSGTQPRFVVAMRVKHPDHPDHLEALVLTKDAMSAMSMLLPYGDVPKLHMEEAPCTPCVAWLCTQSKRAAKPDHAHLNGPCLPKLCASSQSVPPAVRMSCTGFCTIAQRQRVYQCAIQQMINWR